MKKILFLVASVSVLFSCPLLVAAESYFSLNEICVVEKKGDGYWFLNGKEFSSKSKQAFGAQRNQFEWFFAEDGQIVAKVYPALRDAIFDAPATAYRQKVKACPLTDINQKLAATVSYQYRSKDLVCNVLKEGNELKFIAGKQKTDPAKWVLFFQSEGTYPLGGFIVGLVPPELSKVWFELPDDFVQKIRRCSANTENENRLEQFRSKIFN